MRKTVIYTLLIMLAACGQENSENVLPTLKVTAPASSQKVIINEIESESNGLMGRWLIFIHYNESSLTTEVEINSNGQVVTSSDPLTKDLLFEILDDGKVTLRGERLQADCLPDQEMGYLSGIAQIDGRNINVPISARRISKQIGNNQP